MSLSKEDEVGFNAQKWVWFPDEENAFLRGSIIDQNETNDLQEDVVQVNCERTGTVKTISREQLEKVNPPKFDKCDDMASLTYLNEPSVLHNLGLRYQDDLIYTYSGLFLVAINPYKNLNIYNRDFIKIHHTHSGDENDVKKPHIFAITENALQSLITDKQDQSILVTGESGAGKTENTKKIIQYLTSITPDSKDESSFNFEQKILEANPILESFGNSQTAKNNNSSRFGKFIKLDFALASHRLDGANIEWYLLEKSRVVHQDTNERNYHVFYQLLSGLSDHELSALNLDRSVASYGYLKNSNFTIPGVDDKKEYEHLVQALKTVNFELKEIANVIKVLAIILLLGNIEFTNSNGDKQAIVADSSPVKELSKLLEISDSHAFVNSFIKPKVKAGKEFVVQQKNAKQAKFAIDALSKSLYEKLFEFIVNKINKSFIKQKSSKDHKSITKFIGILDIAGFEIFAKNSFEQLCINYTNEKLQQFFNHHMFVLEQNEYMKENINWKFIDYGTDLIPTIELIENKKKSEFGIFAILDEECIVPNSSDRSFLDKLNENLEAKNKDKDKEVKSLRYRPNKNRSGFIVKHYAGDVEYDTEGWLDKNRDPLSDAVIELIHHKSSNSFIKAFYKEEAEEISQSQNSKKKNTSSGKKSAMLRTVAYRHKTQLNDLMTQLSNTNPSFVRCILPNNEKAPGVFDNNLILDQLRCNGVLEGIRIARAGFPNRIVFSEFYERYKILCKNQSLFAKTKSNSSLKQNCEMLLSDLKLDTEIFKVGSTKLFFKNGVLAELEKRREHTLELIMTKFQSVARGKSNRDVFRMKLMKLQASQVIAENFKKYNELENDPWFSLFMKLKPFVENPDTAAEKKAFNNKVKKLKEEISNLKKENSSMKTESKQFNSKVEKINESLTKKRELLETKESELQTLKKHEIELEKKLTSKVSELQKLRDELSSMIEENKELKSKAIKSSEDVDKGQRAVQTLNMERVTLISKLDALRIEMDALSNKHKKTIADHESVSQEIKMLKFTVKDKEQRIKGLEEKISASTKDLESKLANANNGYNIATKKLKEAIAEKEELQIQLSKMRASTNAVDNAVKAKEQQLELISKDMSSEKSRIEKIRAENESMKSKYEMVKSQLSSANDELKSLNKRHQKLQHDLTQSKSLLDSKIEDDVKFGRGKQVHDKDILHLKETIVTLTEKLNMNYGGGGEMNSSMRALKFENEQLLKMKKSLDIKIAELTFQMRNRPGSIFSLDGANDSDKTLQDDYNSLRLQLSESTANYTRINLENKHMKNELSLMQTRLASESYENRQLKAELKKVESHGSPINDENHRSILEGNRPLSRETAELKLQLESERRANKRIEALNISLQKELLQYKGSAYRPEDRLSGISDSDSDEMTLLSKYEIAQAKIAALESQLREGEESVPLRDSTQTVLNGATSSKYVTAIQNENLRLNAKLNELTSKLRRMSHSNSSSTQREEEFGNLKSRLEVVESSNVDLSASVKLYRARADEYYSRLESADIAVKAAKRNEENIQREKLEMKSQLEVLQKESKVNDNKMIKLNSQIRDLEQRLSDARFECKKLQTNLAQLKEKYDIEEEFRTSTSSAASQEHEKELSDLNRELQERMEQEKEMAKSTKYLSLELDGANRKASAFEKQVFELSQSKNQLEKANAKLSMENDKLGIRQREAEKKTETLISQVTVLRSINEDVILERDQLLETKKSLESQVKVVTDEFNRFMAKSNEEVANKVSISELEQELARERDLMKQNAIKLQESETKQRRLLQQYESLKKDSVTMIEENKALTKFNRQLVDKVKDTDVRWKTESLKSERTWQERVTALEDKLSAVQETKIDEDQQLHNLNKLSRDLKNKYEEQLFLTSRYRKENDELDHKVHELSDKLDEARKQESKTALLVKRTERQLQESKETCLQLEKELLNWRTR